MSRLRDAPLLHAAAAPSQDQASRAAMIPLRNLMTETAGRFSGMAVSHNTATALFSGFSPLIATLLRETTGFSLMPAVYSAVIALAALPLCLRMRETAGRRLPE